MTENSYLRLLETRIHMWEKCAISSQRYQYPNPDMLGVCIRRYVSYCISNDVGLAYDMFDLHTVQLINIVANSRSEARQQLAAWVLVEDAPALDTEQLAQILKVLDTVIPRQQYTCESRWTKIYRMIEYADNERHSRELNAQHEYIPERNEAYFCPGCNQGIALHPDTTPPGADCELSKGERGLDPDTYRPLDKGRHDHRFDIWGDVDIEL